MQLLLVEDDEEIARKLHREMERAGHACNWQGTVAGGLEALRESRPEIVLLDLMLPDGTGFDFIEAARVDSLVPIIVLTARLMGDDKIRALDMGADDYVTKPFWTAEVLARIRAVARRHQIVPGPGVISRFDEVVVDLTAMSATVAGEPAGLTPTEFDLLAYFLQHPRVALVAERLVGAVLESGDAGSDALRIHVSRLRKKLGAAGARIETVWGIGYRFIPEGL